MLKNIFSPPRERERECEKQQAKITLPFYTECGEFTIIKVKDPNNVKLTKNLTASLIHDNRMLSVEEFLSCAEQS